MSRSLHLTDCGLPGITKIPYGLHACHFFPHRAELIDALLSFFLAGLYNSEKCFWVTAPPLPASEAEHELRNAWPGVQQALTTGAIRIVDFARWYGETAMVPAKVVDAWLKEEAQALAEGYQGLRLSGNTSFVQPSERPIFMEYERQATKAFSRRRIIALCSYEVSSCSEEQAIDVIRAHDCSFHRPDAAWQVMSTNGERIGRSNGSSP
jgi:hypothetical protein